MLGYKLVKAGWDKADCIVGPRGPDLPSTGMLKVQSYSIGACTQIIWVSASQTYGVGRRGVCQWTAGATTFHSPLSTAWLREETHRLNPVPKLIIIVVKCHKTIFFRHWGHAVLVPCLFAFVFLCLSPSPFVSCVSGLNTPGLPSEDLGPAFLSRLQCRVSWHLGSSY